LHIKKKAALKKRNKIEKMKLRIGILASHNGTNLQSIIDASATGVLNGVVSVVISNNSKSGAAERAKRHGIPFFHLSGLTHPDQNMLDNAILSALVENNSDLIFLAGYMKKIGNETLKKFKGKIFNTHPALLPKFGGQGMYGMNVHKAVIEGQEKESGVTIHLVDENYDTGQILTQTKVQVLPDDTPESLCERVMQRERQFIIEILNDISNRKITL
jgi:phosphoribosylglycinamide formyltransferase-1